MGNLYARTQSAAAVEAPSGCSEEQQWVAQVRSPSSSVSGSKTVATESDSTSDRRGALPPLVGPHAKQRTAQARPPLESPVVTEGDFDVLSASSSYYDVMQDLPPQYAASPMCSPR
eukprot:TRINITY_DN7506_c6_g1_i1.p2 TRINITY_DN7506_c6_g1~~TRINITY_DN7506_c6_g1_i1.p2  ORF type:complete len:116 (+),score=14.15 TRINITY_DN7506_c6_g1_i1:138-485(+)